MGPWTSPFPSWRIRPLSRGAQEDSNHSIKIPQLRAHTQVSANIGAPTPQRKWRTGSAFGTTPHTYRSSCLSPLPFPSAPPAWADPSAPSRPSLPMGSAPSCEKHMLSQVWVMSSTVMASVMVCIHPLPPDSSRRSSHPSHWRTHGNACPRQVGHLCGFAQPLFPSPLNTASLFHSSSMVCMRWHGDHMTQAWPISIVCFPSLRDWSRMSMWLYLGPMRVGNETSDGITGKETLSYCRD